MDNSGHWLPNQDLLWQCGQIFLAEVAIDVAKHAVVGKFNEIRPGVYREFMKVSIVPTPQMPATCFTWLLHHLTYIHKSVAVTV